MTLQIENKDTTEEKGISVKEIESELGIGSDEYYYNCTG
jgi:hypothetical protein